MTNSTQTAHYLSGSSTIPWISKKDLAQMLGISPGLVTRLVYEDGLPHLKVGRSIRFNYENVLIWFEKCGYLRRT